MLTLGSGLGDKAGGRDKEDKVQTHQEKRHNITLSCFAFYQKLVVEISPIIINR